MTDLQNFSVKLSGDMLEAVGRIAKSHPGNTVRRVSRQEIVREAVARLIAAEEPSPPARARTRTAVHS